MDREDPAPVRLILNQVPQKKSPKKQAACGSYRGASTPGGRGLGSVVRQEGELTHMCEAGTAQSSAVSPRRPPLYLETARWERRKPVAFVNGRCGKQQLVLFLRERVPSLSHAPGFLTARAKYCGSRRCGERPQALWSAFHLLLQFPCGQPLRRVRRSRPLQSECAGRSGESTWHARAG